MTIERNIISVEFDLPLPNEFLVDHSFSEGKSRKYTYHGPDKVYLQIGEDGTEKYGPLEATDIADGRPVPEDVVEWFEVDCREYPLICQLRAGIINELQEDYTGDHYHPQSPEIEGYDRYSYGTPLMPMDIFDKWALKVVDGVPTVPAYTVDQKLHDRDEPLTWDDIRKHRDKILKTSDTEIAEDMPESLKQKWMAYRQVLRDLPTTLEAAGVPPNIAYYMFPNVPDYKEPD
jgi:hypothetical protein